MLLVNSYKIFVIFSSCQPDNFRLTVCKRVVGHTQTSKHHVHPIVGKWTAVKRTHCRSRCRVCQTQSGQCRHSITSKLMWHVHTKLNLCVFYKNCDSLISSDFWRVINVFTYLLTYLRVAWMIFTESLNLWGNEGELVVSSVVHWSK